MDYYCEMSCKRLFINGKDRTYCVTGEIPNKLIAGKIGHTNIISDDIYEMYFNGIPQEYTKEEWIKLMTQMLHDSKSSLLDEEKKQMILDLKRYLSNLIDLIFLDGKIIVSFHPIRKIYIDGKEDDETNWYYDREIEFKELGPSYKEKVIKPGRPIPYYILNVLFEPWQRVGKIEIVKMYQKLQKWAENKNKTNNLSDMERFCVATLKGHIEYLFMQFDCEQMDNIIIEFK